MYGHAARNLEAVRRLNDETMRLLSTLPVLTRDQWIWINSVPQGAAYATEPTLRLARKLRESAK